MLNADFIAILRCPENYQKVSVAAQDVIFKINQQIADGKCVNREGSTITIPIDGGLIREDGKYLYPIRSDIPIMLAGEAIALS